ncbi:MAG: hypothetical protein JSS30_02290 [Verrucomicrobia bacterium]|nr:hypothetical protein [Verrucomicrobiota bacterium]
MIKKTIGITLASLGIFHLQPLSSTECCDDFPCCESPIITGLPLDGNCINPGYAYPGSYQPCNSWDFYVKGEFLYWSLLQLTLQPSAQKLSFDGQTIDTYNQGGPYTPGFRVSFGLDLDSVLLDLTYTRVHSKKTARFQAGANDGFRITFAAPSIVGVPILFSRLESVSHIDLDVAVLSLQKPVYFGKKIILSLNYGLAGFWQGQKWNFTGTALPVQADVFFTDNGTVLANHKAWSVGPNLQVHCAALFPWGFQAFASTGLSILYGSLYKSEQTTSFPNVPATIDNTTVKTKGHVTHMQAFHGGEIGLSWGRYMWCDKYHLDISAAYTFFYIHNFVGGIVLSPFATDFLTLDSINIHGLAVGGRLDF